MLPALFAPTPEAGKRSSNSSPPTSTTRTPGRPTPGRLLSSLPGVCPCDAALKGGITTLMKTAHLAEAFHMNYEIHHGGNSLNIVANRHVTMAIRNAELFEVLLPDGAQKYGLAEDITVGRDGMVHAPSAPGLGYEIDFALVERKKISVLR